MEIIARFRDGIDRCYTPVIVLVVLTMMNAVTYFDRGALGASVINIGQDRIIGKKGVLSHTEQGLIVSMFMVGYMVTCPIFAALGSVIPVRLIIAGGFSTWVVACLLTAFSVEYGMLIVARMLVGVGEAAYAGFGVTIIDTIAPPRWRSTWIGIFFSMLPVGTSFGVALGGIVASTDPGFSFSPWRLSFFGEAIAAIPILAMVLLLPTRYELNVKKDKTDKTDKEQTDKEQMDGEAKEHDPTAYATLPQALRAMACNAQYICIVLGSSVYTFVLGGISVWIIAFATQGPLQMKQSTASALLGGTSVISGVVGSMAGGWLADRLGGSRSLKGRLNNQILLVVVSAIATPILVGGIMTQYLPGMVILFLLGTFSIFMVIAPLNANTLSVVPYGVRAYSASFSVLFMHLLGDFPSPTVIGALSDSFNNGCKTFTSMKSCQTSDRSCVWIAAKDPKVSHSLCLNLYQTRNALSILGGLLIFASFFWGIAAILMWRQTKREKSIEVKEAEVLVDKNETKQHPNETVKYGSV